MQKTERPAKMVVEPLGVSLPTKNLSEVKFFVGCGFIRDREAGTIRFLKRVTSGVLSRDSMFVAPARSLLPLLSDYRSVMEDEGAGDVPFREVVGSLMWIANQTRPDISNAVRAVARHSHEPKKSHWKAAQKILNYLLETAHLTLKYKQDTMVDVGTLVTVDQFREHYNSSCS